jgi:ArsR family transcriptional regulator, arsenate/arsenite/antimonite-responsive transcriptional repressor
MMNPDSLFEALADETRRRILALLLTRGELCVCDLFGVLQLPQPKVSRHLAVLRESDILISRKQGTWVHYRLNPEMPLWAAQVLRAMADGVARSEPYRADQAQLSASCGSDAACVAPARVVHSN